eukprot:Em0022g499a
MAENDRKVWVKTMCSITATRITISGDADILEVVKAAKKRIHCLEDVSEDMVTVLCNGKSVSKSLKVDSALEEGIGVSDMSEEVLVLNLSEVWVRCEWNSAVTRIMVSPDAKIADVVEAAVKKMKCMSIETEDVVTVACRGKELSKSQTVQSALKEGLGLSDKNDEVLVLQASEVWVRAETCNSTTRILINGGAYIDDVVRAAIRKLKDLEGVSEDMMSVTCNGQEVRKSLTVSAALQQNLGASDEDNKVLVLQRLHSTGKTNCANTNDSQVENKSSEPKATLSPRAGCSTDSGDLPARESCRGDTADSSDGTNKSIKFKRMHSPSTSPTSRLEGGYQDAPKSPLLKKSLSSPFTEPVVSLPGDSTSRKQLGGGLGAGKCSSNRVNKLRKVNSPPSVKSLSRSLVSGTAPNLPLTREPSLKVSKVSSFDAGSLKASKYLRHSSELRSSKQIPDQRSTEESCHKEKRDQSALRKVRSLPMSKHVTQSNKATHLQRSAHVALPGKLYSNGGGYEVSCVPNNAEDCSEQKIPEKSSVCGGTGADQVLVPSPSHL